VRQKQEEKRMNKTWWMDDKTFSRYQAICKELQGLYMEHNGLIRELREKPDARSRWKQVAEINKRIAKLQRERMKILDENPLLGKNIGKYLG
jgi:hypothetical protein